MAIAMKVKEYLDNRHISYDVVGHRHSSSSMDTSQKAQIPMNKIAKAVVYRDEDNHYLMAVIPGHKHGKTMLLNNLTSHDLVLAEETELSQLFTDCEFGAVPPVGQAYDMRVVWDDNLGREDDLYLEAGDHQHLLHIDRDQFEQLMTHMPHGDLSRNDTMMFRDQNDFF